MAEEARLESVYTPKGYRGFESRSLRRRIRDVICIKLPIVLIKGYRRFYLGYSFGRIPLSPQVKELSID